MPAPRRYDDPGGIARALAIIGARWALLVVRELIFGPKRFLQLRDGLHGISPNVLSQRLRDLEDAGVVRRDVLDPPASVAVYELTGRGQALRPILLDLGRWGSREPAATPAEPSVHALLAGGRGGAGDPGAPPAELSVNALLLALEPVFDPAAAGSNATFALRVDGDWFRLTVAGDSIEITRARTELPTVTFETDVATLRSVAFGREPVSDAERDGRLTVTGDRQAAEHFARMFAVPEARPFR